MLERGIRMSNGEIAKKLYFTETERPSSDALIKGASQAGIRVETVIESPLHAVIIYGATLTPFELIKSGRQAAGSLKVREVVDTQPL